MISAQVHPDVFISYRTHGAARLTPLITALEAAGLTVWQDKAAIREGQSITAALKTALGAAKVLLVYCTDDYHLSEICQWELTTAWLTGLREGNGYSRILVWMAARDVSNAREALGLASDAKWISDAEPGSDAWEKAISTVAEKVRGTAQAMASPTTAFSSWFPITKHVSPRFLGRSGFIWKLAAALHRNERVGTTGFRGRDVVQVMGLPGIGKSFIAVEYAHRFAAAYPGGIFWMDAGADWDTLLRQLLEKMGAETRNQGSGDILEKQVREVLETRSTYLWILDGLNAETVEKPGDEMTMEIFQSRLAPSLNGKSLVTTTCQNWKSIGAFLEVPTLDSESALALLTGNSPSLMSHPEAHALLDLLDGHPMALAMTAALIQDTPGENPAGYWLSELRRDAGESLDLAEELGLQLPTKMAASLGSLMERSLASLPPPARWLLSLGIAAKAPLPWSSCTALMDDKVGRHALTVAAHKLRALSLIGHESDVLNLHSVVRRAGIRLLLADELMGARTALTKYLVEFYAQEKPEANLSQLLDIVVHAFAEDITDALALFVALAWIDGKLRRTILFVKFFESNLEWHARDLPAVREQENPWMLAWALRRATTSFFDELPLKKMASRIVHAHEEATDEGCAQWALTIANSLLTCDQDEVANIMSYAALQMALRLKLPKLVLVAHIVNQRSCYRLGDFRGANLQRFVSQSMMIDDIPWVVDSLEDAACAAYSMHESDAAAQILETAMTLRAKNDTLSGVGAINARYLMALIARQRGRFAEAKTILLQELPALDQYPKAAGQAKILWARLLADLCRSCHDREGAKKYTRDMLTAIREKYLLGDAPNPLVGLTVRFALQAQVEALRNAGRFEEAMDLEGIECERSESRGDTPNKAGLVSAVMELDSLISKYLTAVGSGQEASDLRQVIQQTIRDVVNSEDRWAYFWLSNALGVTLPPISIQHQLIAFVIQALQWSEAAKLLESFDWEFANTPDEAKRARYAVRAVNRLRSALALREANSSPEEAKPRSVTHILLAQALAYFDPVSSSEELKKLEKIVNHSLLSNEDKKKFASEIGKIRFFITDYHPELGGLQS